MLPKYIPVLLIVIGIIAFSFAGRRTAPCDNKPYVEGWDCLDHEGLYVFKFGRCVANRYFELQAQSGVECIRPGYAFTTKEECEAVCQLK